jgi:hypothetical protein
MLGRSALNLAGNLVLTVIGVLAGGQALYQVYGWTAPTVIVGLLMLIPAQSIAVLLMHTIFTRLISPAPRLALDFSEGIPPEYTTLAVMPVIIQRPGQFETYARRLERTFLANRQDNLYFSILADFGDAPAETMPEDVIIQTAAIEAIKDLNRKYPAEPERFSLFWRPRLWNEKQGCWMGWERKRGKLEEFNAYLAGEPDTSLVVLAGSTAALPRVRYIITLDADTELIPGAAAKLCGIMAHPLNHPVIDPKTQRIRQGYAIVQPEIRCRQTSTQACPFARVFAGQTGVDPYATVASDLYQDVFGEGIFTGKGIYDHKAVYQLLRGTIPENSVLSHDLLEGSLTRCAFASGVILMDSAPPSVAAYFRREHRWIRGDWQLLPWLFRPTRLNWLSRWKMLDNLRRSLLPVAQLLLIFGNLLLAPARPLLWLPFVFFEPAFRLVRYLLQIFYHKLSNMVVRTAYVNLLRNLGMQLSQAFLNFVLLPYRAQVAVDAIVRTLYRLLFSHRNLLEWQTAEAAERTLRNDRTSYLKRLGPAMLTERCWSLVPVCSFRRRPCPTSSLVCVFCFHRKLHTASAHHGRRIWRSS